MRIWCDNCNNLINDSEVTKTYAGQYCLDCWVAEECPESVEDVKEITSTDLLLMEIDRNSKGVKV